MYRQSGYPCLNFDEGVLWVGTGDKERPRISILETDPEDRFFKVNVINVGKTREAFAGFDLTEEQQQAILDVMKQVDNIKGLAFTSLYVPKLWELIDRPTLVYFSVCNTNWTPHLHRLSPSVEDLDMHSCSGLSKDGGLEILCAKLRTLKNLKRLWFNNMEFKEEEVKEVIRALADCPKLERFCVREHQDPHWCPITPFPAPVEELEELHKRVPNIGFQIGRASVWMRGDCGLDEFN